MRRYIFFLIAALIFVGCTGTPDTAGIDWCFLYDFRLGAQGFNFLDVNESGELDGEIIIGTGMQSTDAGLFDDGYDISAFYTYEKTVSPSYVVFHVVRPEGVSGDINVTANANVFGIAAQTTQTVPSIINELALPIQSQTLGAASNSITLRIHTDHPIIIESIEIRGGGANPFPYNLCPDGTLTPVYYTPTPTPTRTPTPTDTPNPSETPSPTATPLFDWQCFIDFTLTTGGFSQNNIIGSPPTTGGEWVSGTGWMSTSDGITPNMSIIRDFAGYYQINSVQFYYTITTGNAGPGYQFLSLLNSSNGTIASNTSFSVSAGSHSATVNSSSVSQKIYINFNTDGGNAGSTTVGVHKGIITNMAITGNDPNPITAGTGIICDDATPTPTPTPTHSPTPETLTATSLAQTLTAAASITATITATTTVTGTLPTSTTTSTSTRTPYPSQTPPPPSRTPIQFQTPQSSTPNPSVTPNSTPRGGDAASDAGNGMDVLQRVGDGIGNLVGGWSDGAGDIISNLIGDFEGAVPEPVPGLPLCMSNPTAYDWCAIIYIIEFTILAPGTPGELIIPILQIMFYIYAFIYLARAILWIVRRFEGVTSVD